MAILVLCFAWRLAVVVFLLVFFRFVNYFYVCLILIVAVVVVAKAEDKC